MAECCVQTVNASLIKTIDEGEDVDLALLTYKTTPLNHRLPSPAELLNSRKYKTLLPTCIVPTRLQESYKQIMDQGKQVQAQQNIWTPAEIIQCPTNEGRSYSLKTIHGGIYTRNGRFIKPSSHLISYKITVDKNLAICLSLRFRLLITIGLS